MNPMDTTQLFQLLVLFQIKHFLADYPFQTAWMLGKARPGWDFFLPLLVHSTVHGVGTLMLCAIVAPSLWWLSLVDLVSHFLMDRLKASPHLLGRFQVVQPEFWWSLGFDQMVHHLVGLWIVWKLATWT